LQVIQLPFAIIPLLAISSTKEIMGSFVIALWQKVFLWGVGIALLIINL